MYAVLKQDVISTDGFHVLASKGHIYRLSDLTLSIATTEITDAGVDLTLCNSWEDAVMAYRVLHMEINLEWEGDDDFDWEPSVATAIGVTMAKHLAEEREVAQDSGTPDTRYKSLAELLEHYDEA